MCVCVCVCVYTCCVCVCVCLHMLCVCLLVVTYSNLSFYRQFAGYGKGVGHHKVGQRWMEVNYQQISCMTLTGVHSTMHLMHPN